MAMHRRLLLTGAVACLASPARADEFAAYGPTHTFVAYRSGHRIGTHTLAFASDGEHRTVTTTIDFAVRVIGIVAYRYRHLCKETLAAGQFAALSSHSDDDGTAYAVEARSDNGLIVRRRDPHAVVKASGGGQVPEWITDTLPAGTLPSTHWREIQVRHDALLNTQNGKLARVTITPGSRETIRTSNGTLAATRYAYAGDIRMNQWFDDRGRWVKSTFQAFDGSTIEYILQE